MPEKTIGVDDAAQIRVVLRDINAAWQSPAAGDVALRVGQFVADDAVIVGPDLTRVARGGEAFARSYADFVASATVLDASLDEPQIDVFADVAVATLAWRMEYEFDGAISREAGHDTYVFARRDGAWLVVWRKLESHPA